MNNGEAENYDDFEPERKLQIDDLAQRKRSRVDSDSDLSDFASDVSDHSHSRIHIKKIKKQTKAIHTQRDDSGIESDKEEEEGNEKKHSTVNSVNSDKEEEEEDDLQPAPLNEDEQTIVNQWKREDMEKGIITCSLCTFKRLNKSMNMTGNESYSNQLQIFEELLELKASNSSTDQAYQVVAFYENTFLNPYLERVKKNKLFAEERKINLKLLPCTLYIAYNHIENCDLTPAKIYQKTLRASNRIINFLDTNMKFKDKKYNRELLNYKAAHIMFKESHTYYKMSKND
jgi:hypothetical protein